MARTVVVLAPSPLLTITIEDRAGQPDLHVHAGGQGVWQARMLAALDVPVIMCAGFGGETGQLLEQLVAAEGIELRALRTAGRNGGYVHDRRDGQRTTVAQAPSDALGRHEQDSLYEMTLTEGLRHGLALLSGPHDDHVLPAAVYERLTADLVANRCVVAVDLSGERLTAAVRGGPDLVKVSHEELCADGRAASEAPADLIRAMHELRDQGAGTVVVSRADRPTLALVGDQVLRVSAPQLRPAESKGAGDSMTAGMVATLARGGSPTEALRVGTACAVLNLIRHGLGTGGPEAVDVLAERVEISEYAPEDAES